MPKLISNKSAKNILSYFVSALMLAVVVTPFLTQAAPEGGDSGSGEGGDSGTSMTIKIANPFKSNSIQDLIKTIVNDILMKIGGVVAVLMIMYAGFLFVTARGNTGKLDEAKKALTYAVIGAAILLGAWVISQAISTTIDSLKK